MSNRLDRITSIITTYNRPELVRRAISSVLKQTYGKTDILVIDDGSETGSRDEVQSFCQSKGVRYLYQENKGRSEARNVGLENSPGLYIHFLDDDDELLPGFLSHMVPLISQNQKNDFVFCNSYIEDDNGWGTFSNFNKIQKKEVFTKLLKANFIPNMCLLYRKRSIQGVQFNIGQEHNEDYSFLMKIIHPDSDNFDFTNEPLTIYHHHADNTRTRDYHKMRMSEIDVMREVYERHKNNKRLKRKIKRTSIKRYRKISKELRQDHQEALLRDFMAKHDGFTKNALLFSLSRKWKRQ